MAPDHEIEREITLHRYVREFKPFKEMMSSLTMSNGLHSDEVHGDVVQCFTGAKFSHIALYHSVFVPSIQ